MNLEELEQRIKRLEARTHKMAVEHLRSTNKSTVPFMKEKNNDQTYLPEREFLQNPR
jgi:hypothetical protein